jgi:hypothetical protein
MRSRSSPKASAGGGRPGIPSPRRSSPRWSSSRGARLRIAAWRQASGDVEGYRDQSSRDLGRSRIDGPIQDNRERHRAPHGRHTAVRSRFALDFEGYWIGKLLLLLVVCHQTPIRQPGGRRPCRLRTGPLDYRVGGVTRGEHGRGTGGQHHTPTGSAAGPPGPKWRRWMRDSNSRSPGCIASEKCVATPPTAWRPSRCRSRSHGSHGGRPWGKAENVFWTATLGLYAAHALP